MRRIFLAIAFLFAVIFSNSADAAKITPARYLGNDNLSYPVVTAENVVATEKINMEICAEMERFLNDVDEIVSDGFTVSVLSTSYEIPCNDEFGLLSIIITRYLNYEGAAHPSMYKRTLNFNFDSGQRIFAKNLCEIAHDKKGESDYSPKNVTSKLKAYAKKNGIKLFQDFKRLTATPEEFYFDENLHIHFIFQQDEVAPYAVGFIDIDATSQK